MINFGTLGHYVANRAAGTNDAIVAWLSERDPDGMSVAEIDAQLARLQTLSVEVSKAHTKSDTSGADYNAASAQNAVRLRAAENGQAKADKETDPAKKASMQKQVDDFVASLEADQAQLDNLKATYDSAKGFYENMQRLFNEKSNRLKTMKSQLAVASNTMKTAQVREKQAAEQAKVVNAVVGGSGSVDKFEVALNAMKNATTAANEHAEASERMVKTLGKKEGPDDSFMGQAMAEASGAANPPMATADRIAALKNKAA